MIPPPQTSAMKIPEAGAVYFPRPSAARLKIAPHITDVQSPHRTMKMRATGSSLPNIAIFAESGVKMKAMMNTMAAMEVAASIDFEETLPPMAPPARRPSIMQNQ